MALEDRQPHFPFGEAPEPMPDEEAVRNPILLALPLAAAIGMFGISFGVLAASEPAFGGLAAIVIGNDLRRLRPVRRALGPLGRR